MGEEIRQSREAALHFFKSSNPHDDFMLIGVSDRAKIIAGLPTKLEDLQERLLAVQSGGRTALLDAMYLGLTDLKTAASSRRALMVITDGVDNRSSHTDDEIRRVVREADVQVWSAHVFEPGKPRTSKEAEGRDFLAGLAAVSGGRMFSVANADELPKIAEQIALDVRGQYLLAYQPSNRARDGRWRRIKIKLNPPKGAPFLQACVRAGYYAPIQ